MICGKYPESKIPIEKLIIDLEDLEFDSYLKEIIDVLRNILVEKCLRKKTIRRNSDEEDNSQLLA